VISLAQPTLFPIETPVVSREVQRITCHTGNAEYYTPPEIVEAARRVMGGIDLDPASCDLAQEVVKARTYYTVADNGLLHSWAGRVWLNPPYSMPLISQFVTRLVGSYAAGEVTEAILLTNAASDTKWFHVAMDAAAAICWSKGRLRKWWGPRGQIDSSSTRGYAFCYFGPRVQRFAKEFKRWGKVVVLRGKAAAPRFCIQCGREFAPRRRDAAYCSGACKQSAYRARCVTDKAVTE